MWCVLPVQSTSLSIQYLGLHVSHVRTPSTSVQVLQSRGQAEKKSISNSMNSILYWGTVFAFTQYNDVVILLFYDVVEFLSL